MARKIPLQSFGSLQVRTPFCFPGQRIGVMGGTLNPPHDGHRLAAEAAMKRLGLDWLSVARQRGNPFEVVRKTGFLSQSSRMIFRGQFVQRREIEVTGLSARLGRRTGDAGVLEAPSSGRTLPSSHHGSR